jgi:hypothetical protein
MIVGGTVAMGPSWRGCLHIHLPHCTSGGHFWHLIRCCTPVSVRAVAALVL